MSRIGKLPIPIPKGVEVQIKADVIEVKGPKGTLTTPVHPKVSYNLEDGVISLNRVDDTALAKSQWGLRRTLLANSIHGVSQGFAKTLEVIGVGYKVAVKGQTVELSVGYSHPVLFDMPKGVEAKVEGNKLTLMGIDKQEIGELAARIRRMRPPEPYKGKGIKYDYEQIRRKAGKSGKK